VTAPGQALWHARKTSPLQHMQPPRQHSASVHNNESLRRGAATVVIKF
jgi:hypothetical protein